MSLLNQIFPSTLDTIFVCLFCFPYFYRKKYFVLIFILIWWLIILDVFQMPVSHFDFFFCEWTYSSKFTCGFLSGELFPYWSVHFIKDTNPLCLLYDAAYIFAILMFTVMVFSWHSKAFVFIFNKIYQHFFIIIPLLLWQDFTN